MEPKDRIIVALDVENLDRGLTLVRQLEGHVGYFKVGLELLMSNDPLSLVNTIRGFRGQVFLDGKFLDIPNTVAGAARSVTKLGVWMFNVHCLGGSAMLRAAVEAARTAAAHWKLGRPPRVLGVTILTSLEFTDLVEVGLCRATDAPKKAWWEIEEKRAHQAELAAMPEAQIAGLVASLAELAQACGLDGVISSPKEIAAVRERCGKDFLIVTPGVRPAWAAAQDQKRIMTPGEAIAKGADYLVIGRPITRPPAEIGSPVNAAQRIADEIAAALAEKGAAS